MDLDALYQEIILDHYKNPHHEGLREPFEAEVHHVNPTCGDEVTMRVHLSGSGDDAVIEDVSYDAEGCSISQAATSVMTDLVIGKPLTEALAVHETFLALMQGRGGVEPDDEVLEDAVAFAGVAKFPARVKCALLSWMAWKDAASQIVAGAGSGTTVNGTVNDRELS
jgi:nitrogen fixation protein NifU and related proteins